MGLREVGLIVLSLVTPAFALGAVVAALRLLKFDFSRLPRQWVPPGITAFMMAGAVSMIIALGGEDPSPARAAAADAEEPDEAEVETAERRMSRWILIHPFENWGDVARRKGVGGNVSRHVTEELRSAGLPVRKGSEQHTPLGLHESSDSSRFDLIRHYRQLAPFFCVTGCVTSLADGHLEIRYTLSEIDATVRSSTLIEKTIEVPDSAAAIAQTTRQVVGAMVEALENGDR